jgi:hypothetical protein
MIAEQVFHQLLNVVECLKVRGVDYEARPFVNVIGETERLWPTHVCPQPQFRHRTITCYYHADTRFWRHPTVRLGYSLPACPGCFRTVGAKRHVLRSRRSGTRNGAERSESGRVRLLSPAAVGGSVRRLPPPRGPVSFEGRTMAE